MSFIWPAAFKLHKMIAIIKQSNALWGSLGHRSMSLYLEMRERFPVKTSYSLSTAFNLHKMTALIKQVTRLKSSFKVKFPVAWNSEKVLALYILFNFTQTFKLHSMIYPFE